MGIISLYWIGIIRIMTLLALEYPILKAIMKLKKKGERHFGNHDKYREDLFTIFDNLLDQYKVDLVWWDFSQPKFQGDYSWGGNSFDEEFNWERVNS